MGALAQRVRDLERNMVTFAHREAEEEHTNLPDPAGLVGFSNDLTFGFPPGYDRAYYTGFFSVGAEFDDAAMAGQVGAAGKVRSLSTGSDTALGGSEFTRGVVMGSGKATATSFWSGSLTRAVAGDWFAFGLIAVQKGGALWGSGFWRMTVQVIFTREETP